MSLTTELLKVLNNEEEPLAKRLKIANSAFKSQELPIPHREFFLLKWISQFESNDNIDIWKLCFDWMCSEQLKDLNRSDISIADVDFFKNMIMKNLSSCSDEKIVELLVDITSSAIENRVFQQHFKLNLKNYCEFISSVISNIHNEDLFLRFIKNDQMLSKSLMGDENFYKYFIDNVLITLATAASNFHGNDMIFEEISKLVQKCIFRKNQKAFQDHFDHIYNNTETVEILPKLLLKRLKRFYKLETVAACYTYKIIFHAFSNAFNNFTLTYKCLIILFMNLGIDMKTPYNIKNSSELVMKTEFQKSLHIIETLFLVLSHNKTETDCKINEMTFSNFLQSFVKCLILTTDYANTTAFNTLKLIIEIDPLIVESVISNIIVYIMMSEIKNPSYDKLLISIFEMYAKLHRTQNLISKMIRALESSFKNEEAKLETNFTFSGVVNVEIGRCECLDVHQMLPQIVLEYFTQCVTSLASWQVINLFKTLLFHLGDSIEKYLIQDVDKRTFIEIICILMCQFLFSVRIAEHTVAVDVQKKFKNGMDDMKSLLGKFGNALVSIEHNHALMKAYLDVCYTWAELHIIINYYSNESNLTKETDNENSACNITYLHSYLTSEQWCLLSERISNFGETPCKQIMHKLCIQKLRAMMIFNGNLDDDVILPIVHTVSSDVEIYNNLISDKFSLATVVDKLDNESLLKMSEHILNHPSAHNVIKKIDNYKLLCAIFYKCLEKITKLFRNKRKSGQSNIKKFGCTIIFDAIDFEDMLNFTDKRLKLLINTFASINVEVGEFNINEEKLKLILEVVKILPINSFKKNIKTYAFLYTSSLLIDLKKINLNTEELEDTLIGIIKYGDITIPSLFKNDSLIIFVNTYIKNYKLVFELILEHSIKDKINILKPCLEYVANDLKNVKNMNCCIIALNAIQKHKKTKVREETKKFLEMYRNKICDNIVKEIKSSGNVSIHAFALVLKMFLDSKEVESIKSMQKYLKKYVENGLKKIEIDDTTGWIILFTIILKNKPQFEDLITQDFVLNIWSAAKQLHVDNDDSDIYSKLIVEIFEHIPNEQFNDITGDLLENTKSALNANNTDLFMKHLKVWNSILTCCFNPTKTEAWQHTIQNLLTFICFEYECINNVTWEELINFEIKLIQNSLLLLTPTTLDVFFHSIQQTMLKEDEFHKNFSFCINILESLLKHRKPLLYDRLPSYLQQYRLLLKTLCIKSDSNNVTNAESLMKAADCAHQMEKLTKNMIGLNKHVGSICMYIIADILKQYETITLYPAVKIHLNNCLYSLISLCDQHAITCLLRILSTASTEIFKVVYETYKKYYRFIGKV